MAIDLTEHRRAEGRFRRLLAGFPDAVLVISDSGEITAANPRAEQVFGGRRDTLVGRSLAELLPIDEEPTSADGLGRAGLSHLQRRAGLQQAHRPDGSTFPVEVSFAPLDSEGGLLVACILRDVTQRQVAERKMVERQQRLAVLHGVATEIVRGATTAQATERALELLHLDFPRFGVGYHELDAELRLRVRAFRQPAAMPMPVAALDLAAAPAYLAALRDGRPRAVVDVGTEALARPLGAVLLAAGTRALLDAPLRLGDELVGVLRFSCREPHDWSAHEVAILVETAELLAIARAQERERR
jgi:PAS domain S-box-containing protein